MKRTLTVYDLVLGAVIASAYAALTLAFAPISYGAVQFRFSEAMCVLPWFFPQAVPGLFVGCLISNLFSANITVLDVVFGSLATLVSAYMAYKIKSKYLVPLPAVLINAIVIGAVIAYSASGWDNFAPAMAVNALTVGAGQAVVCYGLGIPLMLAVEKVLPKLKKG